MIISENHFINTVFDILPDVLYNSPYLHTKQVRVLSSLLTCLFKTCLNVWNWLPICQTKYVKTVMSRHLKLNKGLQIKRRNILIAIINNFLSLTQVPIITAQPAQYKNCIPMGPRVKDLSHLAHLRMIPAQLGITFVSFRFEDPSSRAFTKATESYEFYRLGPFFKLLMTVTDI